ncbi:conserved hypothetical protein [Candidatus Desulfarcum epimagneticum]|uniref:DUF4145 domain-containing protein n=1 Tax=uncultured Desulfobacteraceae bacterium TaxID=218296 RepID=A0A484HGF8_9BACT|nr:conserved hypothetical protein [uncultured Desulfobacteraceae bacterium]
MLSFYLKFLSEKIQVKLFEKTINDVNHFFERFSLNIVIVKNQFIPRQGKKITEEIYRPVLEFLGDKKWEEVNRELGDAFKKYQENTPQGYSTAITHVIASAEAFLQILMYGEARKGGAFQILINKARKDDFIPDNKFTKNIGSIFGNKRGIYGDGHPKKEYGTEEEARLTLNLVMVFLQYCIQHKQ